VGPRFTEAGVPFDSASGRDPPDNPATVQAGGNVGRFGVDGSEHEREVSLIGGGPVSNSRYAAMPDRSQELGRDSASMIITRRLHSRGRGASS
jgi:hypothetical protein